MSSFTIDEYYGIWYEHYSTLLNTVISGYPVSTETCMCTFYNMSPRTDGTIQEAYDCTRPDIPDLVLNLTLIPNTNTSEAGKLGGGPTGSGRHGILDRFSGSDYGSWGTPSLWGGSIGSDDEYFLVYGCVELEDDKIRESAFFFSRSADPFPTALYNYWIDWMEDNGSSFTLPFINPTHNATCVYEYGQGTI